MPLKAALSNLIKAFQPVANSIIVGHLAWQGIGQPNNHNTGLPATLTLCIEGVPQADTVTTDLSGFFTTTTALPTGTYNWYIKGTHFLANAGTIALADGINNVEFGAQRAGDANNTNIVNAQDFSVLRVQFGQSGANLAADFNNDAVVNAQDFNLLKGNFGQSGATPNCP